MSPWMTCWPLLLFPSRCSTQMQASSFGWRTKLGIPTSNQGSRTKRSLVKAALWYTSQEEVKWKCTAHSGQLGSVDKPARWRWWPSCAAVTIRSLRSLCYASISSVKGMWNYFNLLQELYHLLYCRTLHMSTWHSYINSLLKSDHSFIEIYIYNVRTHYLRVRP